MALFWVEEKQPNGKWRKSRSPHFSVPAAQALVEALNEHGSGIAFRVVDDDGKKVETGK